MALPTQRIIWTALPDRTDPEAKTLRIHLLVTPRLSLPAGSGTAELSQFQVWQQWPRFAAEARYTLTLGDYSTELSPAWTREEAGNAVDIWRALFPAHTPVRTRTFEDFTGKSVLCYPMADLAEGIQQLYREVAIASPERLPTAGDLRDTVQKALGHPKRRTIDASHDPKGDAFREVAARLADTSPESRFDPADALHMLRTYHRPLQTHDPDQDHRLVKASDADPHEPGAHWPRYARSDMPAPDSFARDTEFHQIVSALGQHPYLMRRCALVIPFDLPLDALTNGEHDLSMKVDWPRPDEPVETEPDAFAVTEVRVKAGRCTVRARGDDLAGGWVNVGAKSPFDLLQLDVDGAGLKLSNLSHTLEEGRDERLVEDDDAFPVLGYRENKEPIRPVEPVRHGLPTLRSAGLQLVRRHRARAIRGLFDDAKRLEDALAQHTEIRLSAEDVLRGYRADVFDDHTGTWQSLMRFDGRYTLLHGDTVLSSRDEEGVLRLGATESPDGSVPDVLKASEMLFAWNGWGLAAPEPGRSVGTDDTVQPGATEVPPGMPLQAEATVHPRSLPSLRFGRSYRVRLRWADLAGGGEPFSPDAPSPVSLIAASTRYLRHEPLETPPLALVAEDVVAPARPQWDGESMQRAALRTLNETPDLNTVRIHGQARRHVVPGRVGHRFAEHHGMLDQDGRVDPALYATLRKQDRAIDTHTVDTPGGKFTYAVAAQDFALPYLPDPLALGTALRVTGVPGIDGGEVHRIPFYGDTWDPGIEAKGWPHARPFTIVAFEGHGPVEWHPDTREFRVPLPKAERARIHVSALFTEAGLDLMHLAHQLKSDRRGHWDKLHRLVLDGGHWMFTPSRPLELVHAVQKPLVVPTPPSIVARRGIGQSTATLSLAPPVHSKSSVRLDVHGQWAELRDDPAVAEPVRVSQHVAPAFERRLARLEAPDGAPYAFTGEHAFADTRYRRVRYQVSASSRFREFMDPEIRNAPEGERLKVTSPEVTCWVKSSAPPPPPRVLYVIPTFGWTRQFDRSSQRSWRNGGGLRVYLDRPWFATGFNEMLAVVLAADIQQPAPENGSRQAPVTQWGADPIWVEPKRGKLSTFSPTLADFPLAVRTAPLPDMDIPGYPAEERAIPAGTGGALDLSPKRPPGNPTASAFAPHAVGFDHERQLWYADIVIRPQGAYFPFVRLALARYQPMSEDNAHLSQVVLTDFQQLTPDRLAVVTDVSRAGVTVKRVAVHGVAPAQAGSGDRAFGGQVSVQVQRLPAGADPDLGWINITPIAVPASSSAPGGRGRAPVGDVVRKTVASKATTKTVSKTVSKAVSKTVSANATQAASRTLDLSAARTPTTASERAQALQASQWLQEGRIAEVLKHADLLQWLLPPLIDAQEIGIPAKPGADDRLRLLVTESERFPGEPGERERSRIVYAEAIPLS